MKRIVLYLIGIVMVSVCHAQNISINAQVVDEKIPEEAARSLETKLQSVLTANGYANNGYAERFVLTAIVDVTQKEVTPTTPARISEKMDITLMVGDVVENKIYASVTIQTAGIGTNGNKTFINAFRSINSENPRIQQMLNEAKEKIIEYYTNQCPIIIRKVQGLVATQAFDEAIFLLISVPDVCRDCFTQCQRQAGVVYQQKIDAESTILLEKARTVWATSNQNVQSANEVADIISQINPRCSNYAEVLALRSSIEQKLQADAKRDWDLRMKQYENNEKYKQSIVDAYKTVAVAYAKNRPTTIYRTIVRSWWY